MANPEPLNEFTEPDNDFPDAPPEAQEKFDKFMTNAFQFIYADKNQENILNQLKRFPELGRSIGLLSAHISVGILEAAKAAKVDMPPSVALEANMQIVQELFEYAASASLIEPDNPDIDNIMEEAVTVATQGMIKAAREHDLLDAEQAMQDVNDFAEQNSPEATRAAVDGFEGQARNIGLPAFDESNPDNLSAGNLQRMKDEQQSPSNSGGLISQARGEE